MNVPEHLIYPLEPFAADYLRHAEIGEQEFSDSSVAFVGLARNCALHLQANLGRLERLAEKCREWRLHIETNDNTDATDQVLIEFCRHYPQATFLSQRLDRQQFGAEFAGPRTVALAEYRTACQRWVREHASDADYVVVIDFDAWGGWSHSGFMHGIGRMHSTPDAAGMASVSLMEWQKPGQWLQYDCWALRLNSSFDDYTAGLGGWKHQWLPPVGSPPVPVASAFGGMAIYDTYAYLKGSYDGSDCEHVPFTRTMTERTKLRMYLDPAMRTVMHWMPEATDGGQHSDH
ncbi:MAG: hypothetical protein WCG15_00075 [Actinomycetes bacterium]